MPLYDYKCTTCDHYYEIREGFDAPSLQTCPECGGEAKRLLHPPPIVFKGSGFYITDSRKGSQATLAEKSRWDTSNNGDASDGDSKSTDDKSSDSKSSDSKATESASSNGSSSSSDSASSD